MNICKEIDCKANFGTDNVFESGKCKSPCNDAGLTDYGRSYCCYICPKLKAGCRIVDVESELVILMKSLKIKKYMETENENQR